MTEVAIGGFSSALAPDWLIISLVIAIQDGETQRRFSNTRIKKEVFVEI